MSEYFSENFDLDSLLTPSSLSLDEERNSSLAVSEYMINHTHSNDIDLSLYKRTVRLTVEDLMHHGTIALREISKDDLFGILNSKTLVTNPVLSFPKVKHINDLFWFLNNLSSFNLTDTKFIIDKKLPELESIVIDSAVFFGFFKYVDSQNLYLIPTSLFESLGSLSTEKKYKFFLEVIGSDKTTRDCINIQLSDPIYDRLSKQMVFNKLKENHNVIEEKLSDKDISKIVNNVRYWFLDIRKYLL